MAFAMSEEAFFISSCVRRVNLADVNARPLQPAKQTCLCVLLDLYVAQKRNGMLSVRQLGFAGQEGSSLTANVCRPRLASDGASRISVCRRVEQSC